MLAFVAGLVLVTSYLVLVASGLVLVTSGLVLVTSSLVLVATGEIRVHFPPGQLLLLLLLELRSNLAKLPTKYPISNMF